jgi:purine-nucleoside phosphorylase
MSTPHNEANIGDIAKTVVMPGDPLRAKYIAENFLDNYKLVNQVRGMYAYTGTYKGKEITVMAHGMGMPSVGIYTYELFKIYGVENIIRIGSCGGYKPELKLFDIILTENVFSESNYALTLNNDNCHIISSNSDLNSIIEDTAKDSNINVVLGNTVCTDCFDVYMTDVNKFLERVPDNFNPVAAEMEAFALFYNAKLLNKKASCLMSVVDSKFIKDIATPEERQTGLNTMIKLALDSAIKILK